MVFWTKLLTLTLTLAIIHGTKVKQSVDHAPPAYWSLTQDAEPVPHLARAPEPQPVRWMTRTIDLREPITRLAESRRCSLEEARVAALGFLELTPATRESRSDSSGRTFELVDVDRFEVTAEAEFFEELPELTSCLEAGIRSIIVECRILDATDAERKKLMELVDPDSISLESGGTSEMPISPPSPGDSPSATAGTLSAAVTTRSPIAVRQGQIVPGRYDELQTWLAEAGLELLNAPLIASLPNQRAMIMTGREVPFVTGFQNIANSNPQPIVTFCFEGTRMDLHSEIRDGEIVLSSYLTESQIQKVETYSAGQGAVREIQLPTERLQEIRCRTTLASGATLVLSSQSPTAVEPTGERSKVYLLTARIQDLK